MTSTRSSGVGEGAQARFGGAGAVRSLGDAFQPNLAMGGGTYRVPIELPAGSGGLAPQLELQYDTGAGNSPFGLGWSLSVPSIERRRPRAFAAEGEPEFSLGGQRLVPCDDGSQVLAIGSTLQRIVRAGDGWSSRTLNLVELHFGTSEAERVEAEVDGRLRTQRWAISKSVHAGGREIRYEYLRDGAQLYLKTIRWSVLRLELQYEDRPDPWSQYDAGFELRTRLRCQRIEVHHERLPQTLMRSLDFVYAQAEHTGMSLLTGLTLTGHRGDEQVAMPPQSFGYTRFDPTARRIERFSAPVSPPPPLADDVTLVDYGGTALPGLLRLSDTGASFWENRGNLTWGPPRALRDLPSGVSLMDAGVRFADMEGRGNADLVVGLEHGAGYYPNRAGQGLERKRTVRVAPSFDLTEEGSYLLDLDGDRVADLLSFRNGWPMAFFNRGDATWAGPVALTGSGLPRFVGLEKRLRMADMNGDGLSDLVLLHARRIVYWPYLGHGRWGDERTMADTPDFDVPDPDSDVLLADLNGDGAADLVLIGASEIRLYLNRAGEGFAPPIVLARTPRLAGGRVLLADMKGSGAAGLLFTPRDSGDYRYLDLLGSAKAGLLNRIDNHSGLVTTITYGSSAEERTRDLAAGRRWSGYLPFSVPVVTAMTLTDSVTQQQSTSRMRYHDGHFDGIEREYLGFAEVESVRTTGPEEEALVQRVTYHTRHATARDPAFIAGRGQPRRTETLDPATGAVRVLEESDWALRRVAGTADANPAHLAYQAGRSSRRLQDGAEYEREDVQFEIDAIGNVVDETRRTTWTDSDGAARSETLRIRTDFARHALHGATSIECRMRKQDGSGALLKDVRKHYDGAPFEGLPLGQVDQGFRVRQTEVALTDREIALAYDGAAPAVLATLMRSEVDAEHGTLRVRDVARARVDACGNEVEVIGASGLAREFRFDADMLHPQAVREDGGPWRDIAFDLIAQQVAIYTDLNGHAVRSVFDPLGNVVALYKREALADRPTESFEFRRGALPHARIQRVRMEHDDAEPGYCKIEYLDGCARVAQVRMLAAGGRWAVGKQQRLSVPGKLLGETDAWFDDMPDFSAAPAGTAERRLTYDHLGRVLRERLFNGRETLHRYQRNEVAFYGPDAADALAGDPTTPPTRRSLLDAGGIVRAVFEREGARWCEVRREVDGLQRLLSMTDPLGHPALANVYDLWGNRIRVRAADGGDTRFVFDAECREIERIDGNGQRLVTERDKRGRITALREGAGAGTVIEQYTYDSGPGQNLAGRLARVEGSFGSAAYSYTAEGEAAEITRSFPDRPEPLVTRFTYNAQRKVRRVTTPDGASVDYRYDAQGMLESIPGFIDAVAHGPTGLRERIVYANGLEGRRGYTPGDYLIRELRTAPLAGGPAYQHLVYELDAVGQVQRIDDLSGVAGKLRLNQAFEYDDRNRLVRATGSQDGFDFTYRYDDLGNLTFNGETATTLHYAHEAGATPTPNRLTRRNDAAADEYAYDACGSMTRDPEIGQLHYDGRHRLVRIDRPDGSSIHHAYDHNDRRVMTRIERPGEAPRMRWDVEGLYLIEEAGASRVVFDEGRRLAVVPAVGDTLLHHFDRLGNVNVISNGTTGAYAGSDEYTPYGRLFASMVIQPAFTFQGARFTDGLELTLLGARWYRPALGRFLTCDPTLLIDQDRIAPLGVALNLYVYAYGSPVNFTDPTGEIAPLLVALIVAAIVGAVIGAIGAGVNGAKTWDEWLLWIVGGAIGGVLSVLAWYGILVWLGVSAVAAAIAATAITLGASVLGLFTPLMDESDSGVAWGFSWAIKLIKSPILTILGLFVVAGFAASGKRVDFRRGALFVEVGAGGSGLTLGGIVYTQSDHFQADGTVNDDYARHEAYHTRTVAVLGEFGFYVTYVTFGSLFAWAQGGPWNALDSQGCGNPFEKHAYTHYSPHTLGPGSLEEGAGGGTC
jgi:RHS repeat-associated protein